VSHRRDASQKTDATTDNEPLTITVSEIIVLVNTTEKVTLLKFSIRGFGSVSVSGSQIQVLCFQDNPGLGLHFSNSLRMFTAEGDVHRSKASEYHGSALVPEGRLGDFSQVRLEFTINRPVAISAVTRFRRSILVSAQRLERRREG